MPHPSARSAGSLALVTMLSVVLLIASPAMALAKSFTMPSVAIDATILTDGSLAVVEKRSFEFSGDYTRVYWDLEPPAGGAITDVAVTGPSGPLPPATADGRPAGYSRIVSEGTLTRVEVYGTWSSETVAYTLSYRVTNAATRWSDTAELYWQAVASNWGAGTGQLTATIRPPAGVTKDQVKVWVHGPLTGLSVVNDDGSVTLSISDLPANTFVEPRLLFPADSLSGVEPRPEPKLAEVLKVEGDLADQANAQRESARTEMLVWGGCALVVPLIMLVIVIALFFRYGKEYKPSFAGEYFREPPAEMSPTLVSYLMTMGTVENASISATLMDLADRGVLRMEPTVLSKPGLFGAREENTFLLTLDTAKWDTVDPLGQKVLSFLFTTVAGDNTLTISEMQDYAKAHAQEFQDGMNGIKAAVAAEADVRGFVEKGGRTARGVSWLFILVAAGAAFAGTVMTESLWLGAVSAAVVITMIVLSVKMTRRSPAAAELYAKYAGLRNYLRDFSRLSEAPPASVVLWNQFLVLAVVFGIAEQVIAQMKVVVPQVVSDPYFATTYWWVASGTGYGSPISSLSGGFTSAASVASSTLSSSSGGGGGFSGGGGGGFGGGGGGGAD
ncbi:MAG: DUF2207 domain-containing protein [Coriobacteriia bacterium]|nr:DUF2207 domain-containing protein [Coriobacteriia bacterium]